MPCIDFADIFNCKILNKTDQIDKSPETITAWNYAEFKVLFYTYPCNWEYCIYQNRVQMYFILLIKGLGWFICVKMAVESLESWLTLQSCELVQFTIRIVSRQKLRIRKTSIEGSAWFPNSFSCLMLTKYRKGHC